MQTHKIVSVFAQLHVRWQQRSWGQRLGILALGILVGVSGWARLYQLPTTMTFLGDQGRDAFIVSRMFTEGDLTLIGPVTSVGNMYLGPLYYYFMLPFLWLTYPLPTGPAYAVAVLSILLVVAASVGAWRWISPAAGLMSAAVLSVSAVAIEFSRFSWNPNPTPLAFLLVLISTTQALRYNARWWLGVGLGIAILLQLHYMAGITAVGALLIWFIAAVQKWRFGIRDWAHWKSFVWGTVGAGLVVIVSFAPLVIFDLRHGGINLHAFQSIFSKEETFVAEGTSLPDLRTFLSLWFGALKRMVVDLVFLPGLGNLAQQSIIAMLGVGVLITVRRGSAWQRTVVGVVLLYLCVAAAAVGLYRHPVYTHYILFIFPAVIWLYAAAAAGWQLLHRWLGLLIIGIFLVNVLPRNVRELSFDAPSRTIAEYQADSAAIASQLSSGETFDVLLFSSSRDMYGMSYRYFLNTHPDLQVVVPDRGEMVDTLVIINEEGLEGNLLERPIYQIQVFPKNSSRTDLELPTGSSAILLRRPDEMQIKSE